MPSAESRPVVIAGAGMTGMLAALLLRKRNPAQKIIIIEPDTEPGGHYRPLHYGGAPCDRGMRMIYETGIAELDALIAGILPASEWHVLRGNQKDIAGIFWNGALQSHSPYIDLRRLPEARLAHYRDEVAKAAREDKGDAPDAQSFLKQRFGEDVASLLASVLEKLYALPASALDIQALRQPAMDRVILFDEETLRPMLGDDALRARIAWPDQLTLPPLRAFDQAALYPKHYGMHHVIDALAKQLMQAGVECIFGDSVQHLSVANNRIASLRTAKGLNVEPSQFLWTGGLRTLAGLLALSLPPKLPLPQASLVHMRVPADNFSMPDIYHFYCFDAGFHTFRVTHYAGYCPSAAKDGSYPLCVELWHTGEGDAAKIATDELVRMGAIRDPARVTIQGVSHAPNIHAAHSSLQAANALRKLRGDIARLGLSNLTLLGVEANDGQMLLYEAWGDMYKKMDDNQSV